MAMSVLWVDFVSRRAHESEIVGHKAKRSLKRER